MEDNPDNLLISSADAVIDLLFNIILLTSISLAIVTFPLDKLIKSLSETFPILDPEITIFPTSKLWPVILSVVVILLVVDITPKPEPIVPLWRLPTVTIEEDPDVCKYVLLASDIFNFESNWVCIFWETPDSLLISVLSTVTQRYV